MKHNSPAPAAFYLIGERPAGEPDAASAYKLRPALLGSFTDLTRIRYDYPLVLVQDGHDKHHVQSLSDIIDTILREIAPRGIEGEALRCQVLGLEQKIRQLVATGKRGLLSQLWDTAYQNMADETATDFQNNHALARRALNLDGEIIDCDRELAERLITHLWSASERRKAEQLRTRVVSLKRKLADILQVDYMHSGKARAAAQLKSSIGNAHQGVFDFTAMSRILKNAPVGKPLPKIRKKRILEAISTLKSQCFVSVPDDAPDANNEQLPDRKIFKFDFKNCDKAMIAFRRRLPEMAELVKAMSIAELEIDNQYHASRHDAFFSRFDETLLGARDMAMFPSYLVCLEDAEGVLHSQDGILETLRSGLPIKIVAQSNHILEDLSFASGQMSFGLRDQQLAGMALGLNNVFALQASSSSLYRLRKPIFQGLSGDRPALFSLYSGSTKSTPGLPYYLGGALAIETRAFPCFVYNPEAGSDLASRCSLDANPQPVTDWPEHTLHYEDAEHNRHSEDIAVTLVDFIAADQRHANMFARIPRADWHDEMVPVSQFLEMETGPTTGQVPYILLIDENNELCRAIVDHRLIDAARRCREQWHELQELGGIHNSYADRALSEAQQLQEQQREAPSSKPAKPGASLLQKSTGNEPTVVASSTAETSPLEAVSNNAPDTPSDDPWIETIRCTTCNECTGINNKMFAYDEDKRAYIADPNAGPYRELVEAAESCQVAIIHPGKPRNQDEPNLPDLIKRAEPFNS